MRLSDVIATCGGVGLSPHAPGTVGSVLALPLILVALPVALELQLVALLALFVIGVWASEQRGQQLQQDDASSIVIDEFVGQWLTALVAMALMPTLQDSGLFLLVVFVCFRVFDIAKPWPISWCDRSVKGGLGVMLDDVVAAVPAGLLTVLIVMFTAG
jgi:phosphatidylglycerophosphatase A